jgi:hypothetical protein
MVSLALEIPAEGLELGRYPAFQRRAVLNGRGAGKAVTLLEILRVHAEEYTKAVYALALVNVRIETAEDDFRNDGMLLGRLRAHLSDLSAHCKNLPMTAVKVNSVIDLLDHLDRTSTWQQPKLAFLTAIAEIQSRMSDELRLSLFFQISPDREKYFSEPGEGWKEVIDRFPDAIGDIEEMSKCFALSRYAGAIFHSLLVVERGVIDLGSYIEVTDPKRGWDATTRKLKSLVDGGHNALPPKFAGKFSFLEQMNNQVQAMKSAWRNKVNHVEGKLAVMKPEFTSDIAEEIMMASRAFMRLLATEMPE